MTDLEHRAREALGYEPEPFEARPMRFSVIAASLAAVVLDARIAECGRRSKAAGNAYRHRKTFEEILKIAPHQIIWGGNYFADLLPPTGQWLVWDKGQRINQSDGELAWTSRDGALRIFELNRVALLTDGAQHPTQKPVELMNWCLGFLTGCRVIMDPFMGSGTTGVACIKRGHPFIGIEADEEYFDIACERIRKAYSQPDFFVEQPKQPIGKQVSLFDGDAA